MPTFKPEVNELVGFSHEAAETGRSFIHFFLFAVVSFDAILVVLSDREYRSLLLNSTWISLRFFIRRVSIQEASG